MYQSKLQNHQTDMLMEAITNIDSIDEAYRFFEDICTISELRDIAQRLEVASMLRQGMKYQDIVANTGASSATVSRVNRALEYGADGYNIVLDKLETNKK